MYHKFAGHTSKQASQNSLGHAVEVFFFLLQEHAGTKETINNVFMLLHLRQKSMLTGMVKFEVIGNAYINPLTYQNSG